MRLFVGLDVSLAKTAICVISEHGKILKEAEVPSEPEALARWIGAQDGTIAAIGLEAGPLSQWLHRALTEASFETVLMETRQVKGALKAMPIKTDRRDAEGIARLLHMGWFRPVHCKSVSAQEVRALLGARKEQRLAVCRELDTVGSPIEQSHCERLLEGGDALGHDRLGDGQISRSLGHASCLGDGEQDMKLAHFDPPAYPACPIHSLPHSHSQTALSR